MWKRIPFFRTILATLSGIFLDASIQPSLPVWMIVLGFFLCSSIFFSVSNLSIKLKWRWIFGISMIGILIGIGGLSNALRSNSRKAYPDIDAPFVVLTITEGPKPGFMSNRYMARVFKAGAQLLEQPFKTYVYIKKRIAAPSFPEMYCFQQSSLSHSKKIPIQGLLTFSAIPSEMESALR